MRMLSLAWKNCLEVNSKMLKDRIQVMDEGFQVMKGPEEGREIYYGEFSLEDDPEEEIRLISTEYWNPVKTFVQRVEHPRSFIKVVEKENGLEVDNHSFYFAGNSKRKSELSITDKPARKYGKKAHLVTIEWIDCSPERISNRYIYLQGRKGERFYFLRDYIEPLDPNSRHLIDQYVYTVPDDEDEADFSIVTEPILREKYRIIT